MITQAKHLKTLKKIYIAKLFNVYILKDILQNDEGVTAR